LWRVCLAMREISTDRLTDRWSGLIGKAIGQILAEKSRR
jgi:hypothetical protein